MIRSLCVPTAIWNHCTAEAAEKYPLETGGLFLGRLDPVGRGHVTEIVGAGPKAIHKRGSLQFDHEWQNAEIARHYRASGRRVQFVGEWHTHPDAMSGMMSELDKATLHKLATFAPLRSPHPVMAIFFGRDDTWQAVSWRIEDAQSILGVWSKITVAEIEMILQ